MLAPLLGIFGLDPDVQSGLKAPQIRTAALLVVVDDDFALGLEEEDGAPVARVPVLRFVAPWSASASEDLPIPVIPPAPPAVSQPPLQQGGQPIGGVPAYYDKETGAWVYTDEFGRPGYYDESGRFILVAEWGVAEDDYSLRWVYTDESGAKTYVTTREARVIARVLAARTRFGAASARTRATVLRSTQVASAKSATARLSVAQAKTTVSAPRARTRVAIDDGGDSDDPDDR